MQNPSYNQGYGAGATKSSTGLDANIAALLAYLFGLLSGIIFYVIEKDSKFVKFHAMQSILFNAVVAVWFFGFSIILPILGLVFAAVSEGLAWIYYILMMLVFAVFGLVVSITF